MVKAPTPGKYHTEGGEDDTPVGIRITLDGEVRELIFRDLGQPEQGMVRNQTKNTWESYMTDFGSDTLAVAWWLAGWVAGDRTSWARVARRFPGFVQMQAKNEDGSFDFDFLYEGEEGDDHPLPSAEA